MTPKAAGTASATASNTPGNAIKRHALVLPTLLSQQMVQRLQLLLQGLEPTSTRFNQELTSGDQLGQQIGQHVLTGSIPPL